MPEQPPAKIPENPKWAVKLSPVELKFVIEFCVDLSATQAALRAGLGKGNKKSASSVASRIRKRPHVAEAISAALTEKSGITATAVIGELGSIAFSRITDYLKLENGRLVLAVSDLNELSDEAKAAISRLKERVNDDGSISIDVELHDKTAALVQLGKAVGVFKERGEVDHNHHHVIDADPLDAINARLDQLASAQRLNAVSEIEPPARRAVPSPAKAAPLTIDGEVVKPH